MENDNFNQKAVPDGLGVMRIANHGATYQLGAGTPRLPFELTPAPTWKASVRQAMQDFAVARPDLSIEEKAYGITLHCEAASDYANKHSLYNSFARKLDKQLACQGLRVEHSAKVIEVRSRSVNKGKASLQLLNQLGFPQLSKNAIVVAAGDADTDEDLFAAFPHGYTIRIGEGETCARFRLDSPQVMRTFLKQLARQQEIVL